MSFREWVRGILISKSAPWLGCIVEDHMYPDLEGYLRVFAMHVRTVGMGWSFPPHEHPYWECNFVLSGTLSLGVNGEAMALDQGDFVVIPPGCIHSAAALETVGLSIFVFHFLLQEGSTEPLVESAGHPVKFTRETRVAQHIEPIVRAIKEQGLTQANASRADRLRLQGSVLAVLAEVSQWAASHRRASGSIDGGRVKRRQLAAEIARLIDSVVSCNTLFYGRDAEGHASGHLDDILKQVGCSASHSLRVFKETYGMSPRQYLTQVQIKHAQILLRQDDLSIEQVAVLMGYQEPANFSRQFKKCTGLSPNQYRRLYQTP